MGIGFHDLCVLDTLTKAKRELFRSSAPIYCTRFPRDGKRIAFYTARGDMPDPIIWIINT